MQTEMDLYNLTDDKIPLIDRYKKFLGLLDDFGYEPNSIKHAALNEHVLSAALRIRPQEVRMFFGLYLCPRDERMFLSEKNLDTGILKTLMMFTPRIREAIYDRLDQFLESDFPIERIVNFVDQAGYRMTIAELAEAVERDYWAAVSGYLKDTNTTSGTITRHFRKMLMHLKIYGPTPGRLEWLERAIIHDFDNKLGIFISEPLSKEFGDAVEKVKEFYSEYAYYEPFETDG